MADYIFSEKPNRYSEIPHESRLFKVCRLCSQRIPSRKSAKDKQRCNVSFSMSCVISDITNGVVNMVNEHVDYWKPKVICNSCQTYIKLKKTLRFDATFWEENIPQRVFTRDKDVSYFCANGACKTCILFEDVTSRNQRQIPHIKIGAPQILSPTKAVCNYCRLSYNMGNHSKCQYTYRSTVELKTYIYEESKRRGHVEAIAGQFLGEKLSKMQIESQMTASTNCQILPIKVAKRFTKKHIRLSICKDKRAKRKVKIILTANQMRSIYNVGEICLSRRAFTQIMSILKKSGIQGEVSVKKILEEKYTLFGDLIKNRIITSEKVDEPMELAFCSNIQALLNLMYKPNHSNQNENNLERIKFGIDDGQGFVKYALAVVGSPSKLPPSSVLNTSVIAMHTRGENYKTIELVLNYPPKQDYLKDQGLTRQLQFIGDLKILNTIHGVTLNGKYTCIWCYWSPYIGTKKEQLTSIFPSRTFSENKINHKSLIDRLGGDCKQSKHVYSIQQPSLIEQFFPLNTPILKATPPPELHILLGVVNKTNSCLLNSLTVAQKSTVLQSYKELNITRSAYWDGSLTGNNCRRLCVKATSLYLPNCAEKYRRVLIALKKVIDSCFGIVRAPDFEQAISNFGKTWFESGMTVTYKVHVLLKHVPEYLNHYEIPNMGLSWTSEQGIESCHRKVQNIWQSYKMREDHSKFGKALRDCLIAYTYRLPWVQMYDTESKFQTSLDEDIEPEILEEGDIRTENDVLPYYHTDEVWSGEIPTGEKENDHSESEESISSYADVIESDN